VDEHSKQPKHQVAQMDPFLSTNCSSFSDNDNNDFGNTDDFVKDQNKHLAAMDEQSHC